MRHLLAILFLAALCVTANAQTVRTLAYNTTNNTVVGPTNANALVFTNVPAFPDLRIDESGEEPVFLKNESGALHLTFSTNNSAIVSVTDSLAYFGVAIEWATSTAAASTRTNLGLGAGLTTNVVAGTNTLVFSNGILTGVNP